MEGYIAFLNAELAIVADRKKKIEVEIAALKEAENKRYATLQDKPTFLLNQERYFLHVLQAVKMELIMNVMIMIRVIGIVMVIRGTYICLTF
ncbi:hypothetical protein EJD97_001143 [Solanum chilense]|uniref:Uncharacterized protein n=1 Tax=Solanum chilense TaxID=4083 RepID=A0A6N2AR48_SOLCI|nr:hypothetical protein EJD97_001143 [Solanum chilense]